MKNIALIKSIVATSISSANPAELTEHIAALIKISEYYLDSNSASRKLIKLSNHGTDCFSQPAHRSRIYVGCSQLWHCSTSLHLSGAAQAAERRQGHGRRPCTHGCCSRYVGRCNQERALSPFQCNYWDVHCRTRS